MVVEFSPSFVTDSNVQQSCQLTLDSTKLPSVKTLEILWEGNKDVFTFSLKTSPDLQLLTKCTILNRIASLFDLLGLVTPFTIRTKVLLQKMWIAAGYDRDDEVEPHFVDEARKRFSKLPVLAQDRVPCCLCLAKPVKSSSLHGFVDASENAFDAVCYLCHQYFSQEVSS